MTIKTFNASLFAGWLLASAGGIVIDTGAGLIVSGSMLMGLTLLLARIAGIAKR